MRTKKLSEKLIFFLKPWFNFTKKLVTLIDKLDVDETYYVKLATSTYNYEKNIKKLTL